MRDFYEKSDALYFCDYCNGEIFAGEVYFCIDTGDIIHTECLVEWARGQVRLCEIEELLTG